MGRQPFQRGELKMTTTYIEFIVRPYASRLARSGLLLNSPANGSSRALLAAAVGNFVSKVGVR
jgi:hypothetical protein